MKEVRLSDSFTIFFYAFHTTGNILQIVKQDSFWTNSNIRPDNNFLLRHVNSFFGNNTNSNTQATEEEAVFHIYEIKSADLDKSERDRLLLFNSLFKRNHSLEVNDSKIGFSFCYEKNMLSPKLILIPYSGIGIFSFGIKLSKQSAELRNLQLLNYHLHDISSRKSQHFLTERNIHPRAFEQEHKIKEHLDQLSSDTSDDKSFRWTIRTWINYLMSGFQDHIESFSCSELKAFAYANLNKKLEGRDLKEAILRLGRIYSDQFVPSEEYLNSSREIYHVFDKIIYGVSLEGAAIIVNPDNNQFFINYAQNVLNRNVWTYLLAYHQRLVLLTTIEKGTSILQTTEERNKEIIQKHLVDSSKLLLYSIFNEISDNSIQNEFYESCRNSLRINKLLKEVKEKTEYFTSIVNGMKDTAY